MPKASRNISARSSAAKSKQKLKAASGPNPAEDDGSIRINSKDGEIARIPYGRDQKSFQEPAIRWGYSLRNRERWNTQGKVRLDQQQQIQKFAMGLGLTDAILRAIAEAGVVEVDIPWYGEEQRGWELRIFPWEYMLAASTRDLRRQNISLTVVRRLRTLRATPPVEDSAPWLQVVSAPGLLGARYDFSDERTMFEASAAKCGATSSVIDDPTAKSLRSTVQDLQPAVIHLSGCDSHQGRVILEGNGDGDRAGEDGMVLASSTQTWEIARAIDLAGLLTAGATPPRLVACNIYHSGLRIAPLCVALGADAAIGFQDSFDDHLAEFFFTTFYRALALPDSNLVAAFEYAWNEARRQDRPLLGSGLVLWTTSSMVSATPGKDIAAELRKQQKTLPTAETIRQLVKAEVAMGPQGSPNLNYSILHNNGPLFNQFRIRKLDPTVGRIDGLMVDVQLHVGADSYPFRMQVSIDESAEYIDLEDKIRISLASALSRAVRESIHTSLFVEVSWEKVVLLQETRRVTLLPIDEWRFDDKNYPWLPSFVMPRDPAVLRVIDSAQRYLMALRDDATAGFDGYQAVDTKAGMKVRPSQCHMVDLQVRAIWSALLYELPMSYINPPPTFTDSSQRLRTPSECIDGRRGTCIDLALLMAACLEFVDIYPTVILLKSHAFPAYWRHESFLDRFCTARHEDDETATGNRLEPKITLGQKHSWVFAQGQYREIVAEVQAGRLVPLETTLVTGRGSFADAIEGGVQNLASRREFESMLDIILARRDEDEKVTPLPIRRSEA